VGFRPATLASTLFTNGSGSVRGELHINGNGEIQVMIAIPADTYIIASIVFST